MGEELFYCNGNPIHTMEQAWTILVESLAYRRYCEEYPKGEMWRGIYQCRVMPELEVNILFYNFDNYSNFRALTTKSA